MADQHRSPAMLPPLTFVQKLRDNAPSSIHIIGAATVVIAAGILLLLTGLAVAASVVGFIVFGPLILISSPVWIPVGALMFAVTAGFLTFLGSCATFAAAVLWVYRYLKGMHPPGSDRVDYARARFADTAGHVKDYAREYGGYLHSKVVRDAAPSA